MGYFLGEKMPTYNPLWEEPHYKDEPDWWKWYHLGHQDGYIEGSSYRDKLDNLEQENESLRGLLTANVRVIKEELRKELDQENQTS